jgi:hypothetical protein
MVDVVVVGVGPVRSSTYPRLNHPIYKKMDDYLYGPSECVCVVVMDEYVSMVCGERVRDMKSFGSLS